METFSVFSLSLIIFKSTIQKNAQNLRLNFDSLTKPSSNLDIFYLVNIDFNPLVPGVHLKVTQT